MVVMHFLPVGSVLPGPQEEERLPRFTGAVSDGSGRAEGGRVEATVPMLRTVQGTDTEEGWWGLQGHVFTKHSICSSTSSVPSNIWSQNPKTDWLPLHCCREKTRVTLLSPSPAVGP